MHLNVTALSGSDYAYLSSDIIFTAGATVSCVDINILEDDALEGNQTFTVALTTSDPDVVLHNDETTTTITDNDSKYFDIYIIANSCITT